MNQIIAQHLNGLDLDIRKQHSGYSRYFDQKVTPDVLAFISDCIWNLADNSDFTVRNIWESNYFEKNTVAFFGKPSPSDDSAASEYDKFIGQSLKTLAYAGVLSATKRGNAYHYSIENVALLEYISLNDRNAAKFLYGYIEKVFSDSGFINHLNRYRETDISNSSTDNHKHYYELKEQFERFMIGHTNINGRTEINRIFPKILNVYAVFEGIRGSEMGRLSQHPFTFADLRYNRKNFRDTNKDKRVTRQSASKSKLNFEDKRIEYEINKAKQRVKDKHPDSEVKDQWSRGPGIHVHHIFPKSKYPKYAACLENLIMLTGEQHTSKAHKNSNFQYVDHDYQIQCLISKCNSIEKSEINSEFFYSKENFIEMINECLGLGIPIDSRFSDIKNKLRQL